MYANDTSTTASIFLISCAVMACFLKIKNKNKLGIQENFFESKFLCTWQNRLAHVCKRHISCKLLFHTSIIQTDFLWFLAYVHALANRATDGYDKFLFVNIGGHAGQQIAFLFFSSRFQWISFLFHFSPW